MIDTNKLSSILMLSSKIQGSSLLSTGKINVSISSVVDRRDTRYALELSFIDGNSKLSS